MKVLLAEQPIVLSLMLGAVAIALVYGWLKTGKVASAIIGLVFAAMIPVAWLIASSWVTERESIREVLYETADAVRENDHDRVVDIISPDQPATIARARAELPRYRFDEARITGIRRIDVIEEAYPPEADVDVNVSVIVSDKRGQFAQMRVVRRLVLRMQKLDSPDGTGESWFIIDYKALSKL